LVHARQELTALRSLQQYRPSTLDSASPEEPTPPPASDTDPILDLPKLDFEHQLVDLQLRRHKLFDTPLPSSLLKCAPVLSIGCHYGYAPPVWGLHPFKRTSVPDTKKDKTTSKRATLNAVAGLTTIRPSKTRGVCGLGMPSPMQISSAIMTRARPLQKVSCMRSAFGRRSDQVVQCSLHVSRVEALQLPSSVAGSRTALPRLPS